MESRYQTIRIYPHTLRTQHCPVALEKWALLFDSAAQRNILQCKFRNIQSRPIQSMSIKIDCYISESEGSILSFPYQYSDLCMPEDQIFGFQTPIFLPHQRLTHFTFTVTRVQFSDGTLFEGEEPLAPDPKTSPDSNDIHSNSRDIQTPKPPKNKRRLLAGLLIGCACLAAFAVITKYLLIPEFQYHQAAAYVENKEYTKALPVYENLGDYKDAKSKISETNYLYAGSLELSGDYQEAMAIYTELGQYKDCPDKVTEMKYRIADQFFNYEAYEEASLRFTALADYKDSESMATYSHAMQLMKEKKFEEAYEVFFSLRGGLGKLKNGLENYYESVYQLGNYYNEQGEFMEAYDLFEGIQDYKDGHQQMGRSAKLAMQYSLTNKKWMDAIGYFELIPKDYENLFVDENYLLMSLDDAVSYNSDYAWTNEGLIIQAFLAAHNYKTTF